MNIIQLHRTSSYKDRVILTHLKYNSLRNNRPNLPMKTTRIYQPSNYNISRLFIDSKEKSILNDFTNKEIQWYIKEPNIATEDPTIVIFVQSGHLEVSRRAFIRSTWANGNYYRDDVSGKPFVFFVCGLDPSCHCVYDNLSSEILINRDILLVNVIDTYDNLTLKGLLAMRWIRNKFGGSLEYVIKTDDDVMLNTFRWLSILRSSSFNKTSSFILGYVWQIPEVKREGRYRVSKEQYPEEYYPSFCAGPGYAMSRDAINKLLEVMTNVRYIAREDVFITGLLAAAGQVSRYSFGKESYKLYDIQMNNTVSWESTMLVHNVTELIQQNVWDIYVACYRLRNKPITNVVFVTSEIWPLKFTGETNKSLILK
ncbi:hypothetical protein LSH36_1704g00003 [Paralvinella palmiformis]|uniref:Hexosyltransferase n=1 Tax=Paralvinella palmiformis TaxID=53620 RepID=A0AAD9IRH0_9ANNE|nr:hypothetical protein LSH36_1704g00003 [Paralvinella palmiformis]